LDALTLAALAYATGVKPPSLYAHIESLDALRRMLAAFGLHELEQELARACLGLSGEDAIQGACQSYRRFARRRPGVYAATVFWTNSQDASIAIAGEALKATVLRILWPSAPAAGYSEQIHLLRLMRISLHGFVALEAAHAFGEPVDIDETFQRLTGNLTGLILGPRSHAQHGAGTKEPSR
jgi:AcrR family transcriptional regulator